MLNQFSRSGLLLGEAGIERLSKARVAVFGIGGVGSFVAEALARSGVGKLDLIDNDQVCMTNINRQLIATTKTIGRDKTAVMKERILEINPECVVRGYPVFITSETIDDFSFCEYDYIADAVDTVTAKLDLAVRGEQYGVPVISCMGAGNKLDPTGFLVTDIYQTSVCPLAKVMRRELKARGVKKLKVVYSPEMPRKPIGTTGEQSSKRQIPGSVAFVPSVAGLILAGEIIKEIAGIE